METANGLPASDAPAGDVNPSPDVVIDGPGDQPWYSTLADESFRTHESVTQHNSIDDLVKSHINLEKKLGERPSGIQPPGENATPEEWSAFYKQLPGYPEAHDKYEIAPPAVPEGVPNVTEEEFGSFLQTMHQSGATKPVVDAAVRWFETYNSQLFAAADEANNTASANAEQMLRQEWGANYEYNMAVALEGLAREYGPDLSWADAILSKGTDGQVNLMGNQPQFLKMALELAKVKGHARFVPGGAGGPASVQAAQDQLSQARSDLREGKITDSDFSQLQERLGPLVYGGDGDGLQMGSITAIDVRDDER